MKPGRPKKSPTIAPTAAQKSAAQLAPIRWAPNLVAKTSITKLNNVSSARIERVNHPTFWNPSAHAATSNPTKTSGTPGSAGSTVPRIPMTTRSAPRRRTRFSAPGTIPLPLRAQLERTAQALPAELHEAPLVERSVAEIVVIGDDPSRIELQHPPQAGGVELRPGVQDRRRQMGVEEVPREEVSREEQVVPRAVEAAVPLGVPRQEHHPQAPPEGELISLADE